MIKLFPIILIVLFFISSVVSFYLGDWKRGLYWFFGGMINLVVML